MLENTVAGVESTQPQTTSQLQNALDANFKQLESLVAAIGVLDDRLTPVSSSTPQPALEEDKYPEASPVVIQLYKQNQILTLTLQRIQQLTNNLEV